MKQQSKNNIKLDWVQEAPFSVRLNRVAPIARQAPEPFFEYYAPTEEEPWRAAAFIL